MRASPGARGTRELVTVISRAGAGERAVLALRAAPPQGAKPLIDRIREDDEAGSRLPRARELERPTCVFPIRVVSLVGRGRVARATRTGTGRQPSQTGNV